MLHDGIRYLRLGSNAARFDGEFAYMRESVDHYAEVIRRERRRPGLAARSGTSADWCRQAGMCRSEHAVDRRGALAADHLGIVINGFTHIGELPVEACSIAAQTQVRIPSCSTSAVAPGSK
ncbi:hypothetical protein [Brevibacterium siliguriense]|uniref:hypothetical protein n=1 Tax=Brevibacterium siliguriense TaxID=1136497 RepID=UPI0012FD1022|nr:hypothetical protein [Brevibacterium siliguriense]